MSRSYYYLVSGLPNLALDETKNPPDYRQFVTDLATHMAPEDAELVRFIRYPYDNHNLANILLESRTGFDERGNFTQEELAEEAKSPERLPAYMVAFLDARKEGKEPHPDHTIRDQLTWLFLEQACASSSEFIRDWFTFDTDLRNVLAAVNMRRQAEKHGGDYRAALEGVLVCRNEVTEQLMRSSAPDFALGGMLPWIERVLSLPVDNLVERERGIDDLRWDTLNGLTTFSYFETEVLLAYCIKLAMVQRWIGLDPDEGKKRLDRLVSEMRTGVNT
ncbi:MAG: DUF2764 family protein [Chitinivibrionales bacterium]|nr:DUF2764 family protein [Chitinivibrionales bacterium]